MYIMRQLLKVLKVSAVIYRFFSSQKLLFASIVIFINLLSSHCLLEMKYQKYY